jgi:uncharacterized protein YjbI with pentapeptide repeats
VNGTFSDEHPPSVYPDTSPGVTYVPGLICHPCSRPHGEVGRRYPYAMNDTRHIDILRAGRDEWNRWRLRSIQLPNLRGATLTDVDLRGFDLAGTNFGATRFQTVNLEGADLDRSVWTDAILTTCNFRKTNLFAAVAIRTVFTQCMASEANFSAGNLSSATFDGTSLERAQFADSILTNSTLRNCDLRSAIFQSTRLGATTFDRTFVGDTIFANVALQHALGLSTCRHVRPSTIGIDTLLRSDDSCRRFFGMAGVPDLLLEYRASFVSTPIQYHSCFISYSTRDDEFVTRLHIDLHDRGVRAWFAPHDLRIGDRVRTVLDESIAVHDKLLLVLSQSSAKSHWVEQEVETALNRERQEGRIILFPIRIDDSVMQQTTGWPAFIRNTRHIGDFTRWADPERYQYALDRVVRDLRDRS